jgi:hypothetical protein
MRSPEVIAEMQRQREQQKQTEMMSQALPAVAGSVKDLAQAEALSQ